MSGGDLSYINHHAWARDVYKSGEWLYHWSQVVYSDHADGGEEAEDAVDGVDAGADVDVDAVNRKGSLPQRVLLLSNHQNLVDAFNIQYFLYKHYPNYRPIFVAKKGLSKLWLFGNYFQENYILVENDWEKDTQTISSTLLRFKNDNIVVVLFPEGCTYWEGSIRKSNEWCKKHDIQPYKSCVCPRTKGLYALCQCIQFDKIVQCHIAYPDDIQHKKAVYYEDYLVNNLPRVCEIYIKVVTPIFGEFIPLPETEFSQKVYQYWKTVDERLTHTYAAYAWRLEVFMKHMHTYHDVVIGYNELTWNSSKYLIFTLPFSYWTYGFGYFVGNVLLLITSYQYHMNNQWKTADTVMAGTMIAMSYAYNKHVYSNIFLSCGLIFYTVEKILELRYNMSNRRIMWHLHSVLHMFAYSHIFIEFLSKYVPA